MMFRTLSIALLIVVSLCLAACDKGKAPYQEAEKLFAESNYEAAGRKALEVIQKAPDSKYLAQAKAIYEKAVKMNLLLKTAEEAEKTGDYSKAVKNYEEITAIDLKNSTASKALQMVKEKYSTLKADSDEAMGHFRKYIIARGTRDYEGAEYARVRYLKKARDLYKMEGGRRFLESRLKDYSAEVEAALNDFLSKANAAQRGGGYEKRVLAADEYNRALERFTSMYGQPEAWFEDGGRQALKNRKVSQWMPRN